MKESLGVFFQFTYTPAHVVFSHVKVYTPFSSLSLRWCVSVHRGEGLLGVTGNPSALWER